MRRGIIRFCLIFAALVSGGVLQTSAQTITTVTATIVDPNGIPYAGARVQILLNASGSPTYTPCVNPSAGCSIQGPSPITTDSTGTFTANLYANASILPASSTYTFNVSITPGVFTPWGTGPQSFTLANVTIAGGSQNLSSAFTAVPPPVLTLIGDAILPPGGGSFIKPTPADGLYYVTVEGSDANDCRSWGTACATVAGAEAKLNTGTAGIGGLISVGAGTFEGDFTLSIPSMLLCNADQGSDLVSDGTSNPVATITGTGSRITQCALDGGGTATNAIALVQSGAGTLGQDEVDHNFVTGSAGAGIAVTAGGTEVNIHDNILEANGAASASGYQISYVEPANESDFGLSIVNNNMDSTGSANGCIDVLATSTATTPLTQIVNPKISGNTCNQGASAGYVTNGVTLAAPTGTGSDEAISGAVVNGNVLFSLSGGAPISPAISNVGGTVVSPTSPAEIAVTVTGTAIQAGDWGFVQVNTQDHSGAGRPTSPTGVTDDLGIGDTWAALYPAECPSGANGDCIQVWYTVFAAPVTLSTTFHISAVLQNPSAPAEINVMTFLDASGIAAIVGTPCQFSAPAASWHSCTLTSSNNFLMSVAYANESITGQPAGFTLIPTWGSGGGRNSQGVWLFAPSGSFTDNWSQSSLDAAASSFITFSVDSGPTDAVGIGLIGNVTGAAITGNTITLEPGVSLAGGVSGATVTGNNFTGPGATSAGAGVTITSSSNNLVDGNTFVNFDGTGAGAVGIDITNSGATSNCGGVNLFTNVTTPLSDSGTTTGCPNTPFSGGGAVQLSTTCTLSGNVSVPATTLTPVATCSATMPSTGGPFHVLASYNMYVSSSNSIADSYITDGTNIFGSMENESSGGFHTSQNASALSPVTYANSASVTFTVEMQCGSASTVEAAPTQVGQNSWMQITVLH